MIPIFRHVRYVLLVAAAAMANIAATAIAQEGFTDLGVWYTNSARGATLGQYFKVTLYAYNGGWDPATNVVVTNWCPAGLQFISATSSRGTCVATSGVVTCNFGILLPTWSATVTMEFKALSTGTFTNTAAGGCDNPDSNPTNSQSSFATLVTPARFFAVGRTHTGYFQPTVTPLPNNRALIVGAPLVKTSDAYNASTRLFEQTGDTVSLHAYHTATMMNNGLVLVVGGDYLPYQPEVFDPSTSQFRAVGNTYAPRWFHQATLLGDGRVLLCGNAYPPLTNEVFDPVSETFSLAPDLQCAPTGTLLPNGQYFTAEWGHASLYDPVTGTNIPTGTPIEIRSYHSTTLMSNGKVLLAGGQIYNSSVNQLEYATVSAELYDIATGTFTPTAPMTMPHREHGACLLPDGTVLIAGGITNYTSPSYDRAEIFDPNGSINVPGIGVSDTSVLEGNSGTNWMQFNVWLTTNSTFPVTVDFSTAIGTAGTTEWGVGNVDFIPTNGTLTIPPGQTNAIINVAILGDGILESNETLTLNISLPTQAWMARPTALGTILNDDSTPTLAISPVTPVVTERDSGVADLVYTVSLSAASFDTVTVDYFTSDVTAQAGSDYVPISGTLTFQPGETNKVLIVQSIGDLQPEPDETFTLNLTNAQYALISAGQATGTILNDDGFAGVVHHFDIAPISGVKTQTFGFPMTITARDAFGSVVTNFSNQVRILTSSSNVVATNLDFEMSSLAPWVPLPNGDNPGPYEMIPYDVVGNGRLSSAFRMRINPGTDGILQNVQLTGGVTYTLSVDLVSAQEGGGCWVGAGASLGIGNSNGYWNMPDLCGGQSARGRIELPFTAPTNGVYPLNLIVGWGAPWWDIPADYFLYADNVQIAYPALTPTVLTNGFTNGVWTGMITPLQGASNVVLIADDTEGHKGFSNPIDIEALADLGLSGSVIRVPSNRTGDQMVFNLILTNRGPAAVSDAVVQTILPANLTFLYATNSRGTVTNSGGVIQWAVGLLPTGTNAIASIVTRADINGTVTNLFVVSASALDTNLSNNAIGFTNEIFPPVLHINPASGTEAFASATGMVFTLSLSGPNAQTVSVDYYTADSTAIAGSDYVATNGTVVFPPFTTNALIRVFAIDDILDEPDRTFNLVLTNYVNAVPEYGTPTAGTVLDDDPPPAVSIADATVVEGDSGTTNAVFQLSLSKPAISDVTVYFRAADGTATVSNNDYVAISSSVLFPAGITNGSLSVQVRGNTVNEPDETFFVNLYSVTANATIARAQAVGTILNDDAVPGRLDHFVWDAIPSPRYKAWPFPVTLRAADYLGNPASNGISSAIVIARTENGFTNRMSDDFEDGDSVGWTNFNSSFTSIVTNDTAAQGSNSLHITGSTGVATAGFRRSFSNSQPNRISFSVRVGRTNQIAGRLTAYAGGIYRSAVFYFNNNGQMGLMDGQRALHGVQYQSNQWYHVDLYFNWASQRVDCRIDGALVITNITFPDFTTTMDAVALANQDNATSWWDDIRVYNDNVTNIFAVTPSNFTAFANGVKSNSITVGGTGTNIFLIADDGLDHVGKSGFFDLLPVKLSLLAPLSLTEGSAPTNAQVTIPIAFPQPVTVNLTSTAPTRLTMPASVIIAANQTNANFSLGVVDDAIADWMKLALITASGTNVDATTNALTLIDNDPAMGVAQYGRMADGRFQIGLQGPPAQTFVLFASSNLMDWNSISNITFSNGPVMIADPASTNLDRRYYRLLPAGP